MQPSGDIGMQSKSCGPLRYVCDDNFYFPFACRSRITFIYFCGISLSNRLIGNELSNPHSTDFKFTLKVCIPFFAKFMR